jgi:hypothetical protein
MVVQVFHRRLSVPKPTPNPPESTPQNDPADPASDLGFDPSDLKTASPHTPRSMYVLAPDISTETLLASACESLASASVIACDFAVFVSGPQRKMLLGIQQLIMLADLAVNRALDNIDPQE